MLDFQEGHGKEHLHGLQVVLTTIEPRSHGTGTYDAYEYVVHSHQYITDEIPAARFSYELSPIQVRYCITVGRKGRQRVCCSALH